METLSQRGTLVMLCIFLFGLTKLASKSFEFPKNTSRGVIKVMFSHDNRVYSHEPSLCPTTTELNALSIVWIRADLLFF